MGLFTPEQFARQRALDELAAQRAANAALRRRYRSAPSAELQAKRDARAERGGEAMTGAERVRKHIALTNDIKSIPAPENLERREACRYDFPLFVKVYGGALIKDRQPSPMMVEKFLKPVQEAFLDGGQVIAELPRGLGKTTIFDLAMAWAISFGHRHFGVLISATGKLAKTNLRNILAVFLSPVFVADFPAIGVPLRALNGKWQLCESQTYLGVPTGIETKGDHITLPTIVGEDGKVIGDAAGAIVFSVGVGGAIRGLNEVGRRPDAILFDDIQKRKDAKSVELSAALEEFVNQDAMGLFGHGGVVTAMMALTPICDGDFASLMTDKERNGAWVSIVIPLVVKWPDDPDLSNEFVQLYKEDCARDDFSRTLSTAFYREHAAEISAGAVLLDPGIGGPNEVDAYHHVLVLLARVGREAFDAEYQMQVREEGAELALTVDTVKHALTGTPRGVLPPGTDGVAAFVDVNIKAESGLRYGIMAFGPSRVTSVVYYGRYPERGRLFPEETPPAERGAYVAAAVRVVGKIIAGDDVYRSDGSVVARGIRLATASGRRVTPVAVVFDGGNWTRPVARACHILRTVDRIGPQVAWSLGRSWSKFNEERQKNRHLRGDHMFIATSANGSHLVVHADYWRETAQSLLLSPALSSGSCALYGSDPYVHDEFAQEVCAERLVRKFVRPDGRLEWVWALRWKQNHWGDVLSGCLAVGSWYRLFESDLAVVDRAVAKISRTDDAPPRAPDATGRAEDATRRAPDATVRAPDATGRARAKPRFKSRFKLK